MTWEEFEYTCITTLVLAMDLEVAHELAPALLAALQGSLESTDFYSHPWTRAFVEV